MPEDASERDLTVAPPDEVAAPPENDEPIVAVPIDDDAPLTVGQIAAGAKDVLDDVATTARRLVDRGRYRKLRISRKGKQIVPDIPLAAVAAIEAASLYGAGVARVLAANVGAKFLFDVEVVNEADAYSNKGKQALLDGDLDAAREALEKALRIDDTHAEAFLELGVLFRLTGQLAQARAYLERARELDDLGRVGERASAILAAIDGSSGS